MKKKYSRFTPNFHFLLLFVTLPHYFYHVHAQCFRLHTDLRSFGEFEIFEVFERLGSGNSAGPLELEPEPAQARRHCSSNKSTSSTFRVFLQQCKYYFPFLSSVFGFLA